MPLDCYNYAIRLLSIKDYSTAKLTSKLQSREFEESDIKETIERLIEQKYLREEEFTKSRIRTLARKGKSNEFIRKQCLNEELEPTKELIEQTLEDAGISQEENVNNLIQRKMRQLGPIPTDKKEAYQYYGKVARFLASRGHRIPRDWSKHENSDDF